jgi:hypothetical protein
MKLTVGAKATLIQETPFALNFCTTLKYKFSNSVSCGRCLTFVHRYGLAALISTRCISATHALPA